MRPVFVSSYAYDRGRGRMEEGGGRCMVRGIPHSAVHGVQLRATFGCDGIAGCLMSWWVGH